tara:strand:+ start:849 stop:1664 length:816 start_codon:yes stop_codon:yes gene_type:complete
MEKIECKACSASVDKSIEFCSSCGEWLGLNIKEIENLDTKTEPEIKRRIRPPEELLSQPLSNYGATSLPTRNEVPGIRAVFFLAIIIPLIAAASYYYNQNIAEEVVEEIQVVEQSTTTSTSTTVQSLLKLQYPFSCSASSSFGSGWSCEKIYDGEPSSWQDKSLECADATLEFTFSKDIYFQFLTYENLEDSRAFKRNFKPRDILITSEEEGFSIEYELENQNTSSQWIDLNTSSSVITIQILSAYPGEEVSGFEAFRECAIQEITFYGRG